MSKRFRENWVGKGKWKHIAAALNDIGKLLNNLRGQNGITVTKNSAGGLNFTFTGQPYVPSRWVFVINGQPVELSADQDDPTKPYWMVTRGGSPENFEGPLPSVWPPDTNFYEKALSPHWIHVFFNG